MRTNPCGRGKRSKPLTDATKYRLYDRDYAKGRVPTKFFLVPRVGITVTVMLRLLFA